MSFERAVVLVLHTHREVAAAFKVSPRQLTEARNRAEQELGRAIGIPVSPGGRDRRYDADDVDALKRGLRGCLGFDDAAASFTPRERSAASAFDEASKLLTPTVPKKRPSRSRRKSGSATGEAPGPAAPLARL